VSSLICTTDVLSHGAVIRHVLGAAMTTASISSLFDAHLVQVIVPTYNCLFANFQLIFRKTDFMISQPTRYCRPGDDVCHWGARGNFVRHWQTISQPGQTCVEIFIHSFIYSFIRLFVRLFVHITVSQQHGI